MHERDHDQRRVIVVPVRTAVLGLSGALVMFFLGVLAARAGGGPGGPTTDKLSFAGVLTGAPSPSTLTFHFNKNGAPACDAVSDPVTLGPSGSFQTQLTLPPGCASTLFDGSDVTYTVSVNGTQVVAAPVPVN